MSNALFDDGRIALIGVPSSAGARRVGQEQAPAALRRSGLAEALVRRGADLIDLGDLGKLTYTPDIEFPKQQNAASVIAVAKSVAELVRQALIQRARPLILGGDCTITLGVLAALTERIDKLGLAYFDGDLDLNTPETTQSGILDGMVLAHILGYGVPGLSRLGPRSPLLTDPNVVPFGYSVQAGWIDAVETDRLQESTLRGFPRHQVQAGPIAAARQARQQLEAEHDYYLVHFDVDVIDYDDLPAADLAHRPGLSLQATREALGHFLDSRKCAGLVVTEFNAADDENGDVAARLVDLIAGTFA